jgi:GT2 family glycosyltransferase
MAISVIVSNFNGATYLPRLLETLEAQQGVTLEIIVVDRHSTDDSARILAAHPGVKVVAEPPESGLVAGYQTGAAHAQYEHLFFCNEDMWFDDHCLARCECGLSLERRIAAVMPIQWTYDGKAIVNEGMWFAPGGWNRDVPYPFAQPIGKVVDQPTQASGVNAGACMIHKAAFNEIGGWDTSFFLDFEDLDLSLRLWQRGWKCLVVPDGRVFHAVGASNFKPIQQGRTQVGHKRYIAALSNQLVIVAKTFTGLSLGCAALIWLDRVVRDIVKLRVQSVALDFKAAALTLQRLPAVFSFRRRNRRWNSQRAGQNFFKDPQFDANRIPGPHKSALGLDY